jgi:hypothetical protein
LAPPTKVETNAWDDRGSHVDANGDGRVNGHTDERPNGPEISAKLETALVRELLAHWKHVNESYFKGALVCPSIEMVAIRGKLGRWVRHTRTIEISRPMVLEERWGAVVEVLKHEMAHQYVHEVLDAIDETAHGPAFRDVCHRLGIDGAASGLPSSDAPREEDRIIERVARLLALAESPNVHEAEAATMAAQRLILKHNLEARTSSKTRAYASKHLGKPNGRITEYERILAMLLGKHFFVECIWVSVYRPLEGKRGSVLEICGTPSNLEIAEYVHGYLSTTAERLWNEHKREQRIAGNRDRRTFIVGVMSGFSDKLGHQSKTHREEGLVWMKDADLGGYFRRRHPYVRHFRHAGTRKNEAYAHGREAGRRIILHRGVNAATENRGRLLTR